METVGNFELTDEIKQAIHIAQSIARENANPAFSAGHLLKALLHKDIGLIPFLESLGKDFYFMEEWADVSSVGLSGNDFSCS